jgi:RNA polymerase sigma-70 factor, ECF subfamily
MLVGPADRRGRTPAGPRDRYGDRPVPPDHDPPAPPGAAEPRSGPNEVAPRLLAAARRGDPGAFAQLVEHWDPHLRRFVHHVLGGEGSTDRVLAVAYVRAYRALPRYPGGHRPGLWLHRMAYLAAVDELRRLRRDPTRRRHRARPAPPPPGPTDAEDGLPVGWTPDSTPLVREMRAAVAKGGRSLGPDQRALATMVDLEGFDLAAVADAFDSDPDVVAVRIRAARRILLAAAAHIDLPDLEPGTDAAPTPTIRPGTRARRGWSSPRRPSDPESRRRVWDPLEHGVVDPFAVPAWAEAPTADDPGPAGPDDGDATDDPDAHPADRAKVALLLASTVVPDVQPSFWSALGRRLLAEQERPAAPTPDPAARLARATPTHRVHPAEPGFVPGEISPTPVSTMAGQAGGRRTRRSWRRPLAALGVVVIIGAMVAGAVAIGVSTPTPDGSVSGEELADTVQAALTASPHLRAALVVEEPAPDGPDGPVDHQLVLAHDGSWSFDRTEAIDRTTYSAPFAITQRVTVDDTGGEVTVGSEAAVGIAPGAPDGGPGAPAPLSDLQAAGSLLRADPETRAPATRDGDIPTWTFTRPVASGPDGTVERWEVVVGRDDGFVRSIERRSGDALVRRTTFVRWEPMSEVDHASFVQAPPPDTPAPDAGFAPTVLDGVAWLGRGPAVTPGWLPAGYDLATVAIRPEAPPEVPSTAADTNPPDASVASLAYQRGPERAVVTTRALTAPATDWSDPFGPAEPGDGPVAREVLGGGRYNGTSVEVRTDAVGRARLWGRTDDTVFTVSGDLTAPEAVRMAASLR